MPQENIFPPEKGETRQIEDKVLILYFIDKMDIPVSNSQIALFAQTLDFMNYYAVQEYLNDMVSSGVIEKMAADNKILYIITEDGQRAMEAFWEQTPRRSRNMVINYIAENGKKIKQEYEVIANYFFDNVKKEYIVKCAAFEEDLTLMELNVSVVTREQATFICNNWKGNSANIYGQIMKLITTDASVVMIK